MKEYIPPKKTLHIVQIRVFIALALLVAITSWVWFLTPYISVAIAVALVIAVVLNFIYLPIYFKNYSLSVNENAIIIKSGVLLRHERIIPFPRLVFAERQKTILARAFGVSSLILRAARAVSFTAEFSDKDIEEILGAVSKWE